MRCYLGVITTPTADTPGSLFYVHFDDRRYLIGNLSEGSTRASSEVAVSLRKVSDVFITGRTKWSNVGGLLGMVLNLADTKGAAEDAAKANAAGKPSKSAGQPKANAAAKPAGDVKGPKRINVHGAPNLNHVFATSRRFIFRRGLPIKFIEHKHEHRQQTAATHIDPTFVDDRLKVWAIPTMPSPHSVTSHEAASPQRKRSHDEANIADNESLDPDDQLRKHIVHEMFDSEWRYDRLVEKNIADVKMPATCYLRDPNSRDLVVYTGPKPGQGRDHAVPDIKVLVREPWPSVKHETLPQTTPAAESVSYVFRNHEQRGKFKPAEAERLGIPKDKWNILTSGQSYENDHGVLITPDMVLEAGRPGSACAIIDLPTPDYIDSFLQRPEWQATNVVESLEAMIWILGPNVGADIRLNQFQERFAHVKHYVSSTDYNPNTIALDGGTINAMRHNHVDPEIFPRVEASKESSSEATDKQQRLTRELPLASRLDRGQKLVLEPKYELDNKDVVPSFDATAIERKIQEGFALFPGVAEGLQAQVGEHDISAWQNTLGPYSDVEIIVLGTGSSHPSKYRNVSGTLVRIPGWGTLLLDCGEGTLNTMQRMFTEQQLDDILADLNVIWISHLHADHHLGTTSMIKAWNRVRKARQSGDSGLLSNDDKDTFWGELHGLMKPKKKLAVISHEEMPKWLHEYAGVEDLSPSNLLLVKTCPPSAGASPTHFEVGDRQCTNLQVQRAANAVKEEVSSRSTKGILEALDIRHLNTVYVDHCHGAQAVSMEFPNGFRLSYSGDCRPCASFVPIGKGSHVLIHEATFEDDMRLEAIAKRHSTAGEALIVAAEMEAKVCVLTHFSQRYPTMPPLGVDVASKSQQSVVNMGDVFEASSQQNAPADIGDDATEIDPTRIKSDSSVKADTEYRRARNEGDRKPQRFTSLEREGSREEWLRKRGIVLKEAQLIDQADIQRLIDDSGVKVVFAFDYMRLKLANVPRLLLKQTILRAMYDLEIGKDLIVPESEEADKNDGESKDRKKNGSDVNGNDAKETEKERRKRERKEKGQKEQDEARERKRSKSIRGERPTVMEAY